jgi:hypothetical protein
MKGEIPGKRIFIASLVTGKGMERKYYRIPVMFKQPVNMIGTNFMKRCMILVQTLLQLFVRKVLIGRNYDTVIVAMQDIMRIRLAIEIDQKPRVNSQYAGGAEMAGYPSC